MIRPWPIHAPGRPVSTTATATAAELDTTEEPIAADCGECGCQYGVIRREPAGAGRWLVSRWCQDCGAEGQP